MGLKTIDKKMLELIDKSTGVSIDSRTVKEGDIFFALKGENVDGNKYAAKALKNGALAAIVDDENYCLNEKYVFVPDVLKCLQETAKLHRMRFDIPVIAITGTNGKTTTKELLTAVLARKFRVHATQGNFNNHMGVPLTLLQLRKEHEVAIIEMGASGQGEIEFLCQIALPTAGLVTNIGTAHIEGFGSEEIIAQTKSELYDFLKQSGGNLFLPKDVKKHPFFETAKFFGTKVIDIDPEIKQYNWVFKLNKSSEAVSFSMFHDQKGKKEISTQLFGNYNIQNLINVFSIASHFGVSVDEFKIGVENYRPSNNRSQIVEDSRGNRIILDAYNANPSSMKAAIEHFVSFDSPRQKVAILGDMLEMGEESFLAHLEVIKRLMQNDKVLTVFVGDEFLKASKELLPDGNASINFYRSNTECIQWWKEQALSKALVLVKGSRGIALEQIFQ